MSKEHTDIQMANKHMKRCSTSLIVRDKPKLQGEITTLQSEWPLSKSLQTINAGQGVEKREPSWTVGGAINWYIHYGRKYVDSLKKQLGIKPPYDPSPATRCIPGGNQNWKRHMYLNVHCSNIDNI